MWGLILTRKNVLITGVNRGIGKAALELFLLEGYNVIGTIRQNTEEFDNFKKTLSIENDQWIKILKFDITNYEEVSFNIKNLYKDNIILDVLVNNAGVPHGSIFEMTPVKKIKNIFETNFFSQINLIQLVLRMMKKSNSPSIINIGSLSGVIGGKGNIAYGSSKAALMYTTKVMAEEFAIYNIRVNSIAPNVTKTEMLKQMDPKSHDKLIEYSFQKRSGSVGDICNLIVFLASSKSSYLNGQIIRIDGGMLS